MSSDIVSSWTVGVSCFNKRNWLILASSVFKKLAVKVWSKIDRNTLKKEKWIKWPKIKSRRKFFKKKMPMTNLRKTSKYLEDPWPWTTGPPVKIGPVWGPDFWSEILLGPGVVRNSWTDYLIFLFRCKSIARWNPNGIVTHSFSKRGNKRANSPNVSETRAKKFRNLGPSRTDRSSDQAVRGSLPKYALNLSVLTVTLV